MGTRSKSYLTALSAAGVVGQWSIDARTQTMTFDTHGAAFFFGDDSPEGLTLPLTEAFLPVAGGDRASLVAYCGQLLVSGGSMLTEARVNSPTAGARRVECRGHFAWGEGGVMIGRGVLIDVTESAAYRLVPPPEAGKPGPRAPQPDADPLAEAATLAIELRTTLGQSGHSALRLAADLLLWEINTALATRLTVSDKAIPSRFDPSR